MVDKLLELSLRRPLLILTFAGLLALVGSIPSARFQSMRFPM
jgi:hypothetical protein